MKIKPFNSAWFIMLTFQAVLAVFLTVPVRCYGVDAQVLMKLFCIMQCLYLFLYKLYLSFDKEFHFNIWDDLPFYLCNICTILCAISCFTGLTDIIMCYSLVIGTFGALLGLMFADERFCDIPLFSGRSIGYYGYHGLLMITGFLWVTLGIYEPEYKDLLPSVALLALFLLISHIANLILRSTVYPQANYNYTCDPKTNPVFRFCYRLVPIRYVYQLLLAPIWIAYGLILISIIKLFQ